MRFAVPFFFFIFCLVYSLGISPDLVVKAQNAPASDAAAAAEEPIKASSSSKGESAGEVAELGGENKEKDQEKQDDSAAPSGQKQGGEVSDSKAQDSNQEKQESHSFTLPEGLTWQTNLEDPIFADTAAQPGGTFNIFALSFPATFRTLGPQSRTPLYGFFKGLQLTLTHVHPNTSRVIPLLATHWAINKKSDTAYYKLHKGALYSDGKPVMAKDYLFTLEMMRSPHIKDPYAQNHYTDTIHEVIKHAQDVISVSVKTPMAPKALLITTSIHPTPRHFHRLNKSWVRDYNWKIEPHTGPYLLKNFSKGKELIFQRIENWWAQDLKYLKHRFNIQRVVIHIIRSLDSAWQRFLKGNIHRYGITSPTSWHEKARGVAFDKGYIRKIWFYTQKPTGLAQIWLNQNKSHWQNTDVRHAFAHALNFRRVNQEVLRNEYHRLESLYQGFGSFTDTDIKARRFEVDRAHELMKKAGYSLSDQGIWQKDGKELTITITYGFGGHTSRLVVLQQEAKKAGFLVELDWQQDSARFGGTLRNKSYDVLSFVPSLSHSPYPDYRTYFHSEFADEEGSHNYTQTKDKELDALIDAYDDAVDEEKKAALSQQILQAIHQQGAFIPSFSFPYQRLAYQSYWRFPKVAGTKSGGLGDLLGVSRGGGLLWFDAQAKQSWDEARKAGKAFEPEQKVIIDTTYKK